MKNKQPAWRIGVTLCTHHIVELQAESFQKACHDAVNTVNEDQVNFLTGKSNVITSCLLNDRESRDFACYVPEFIERTQNGNAV